MFIISEAQVVSTPKNVKKVGKGEERIRFEALLQTADTWNKNRRKYPKRLLEEGIQSIRPRLKEGSLLGELDHPTDKNIVRQIAVLFKEASHRILELGWDGNKLIGTLETIRTPNGQILKNLAEDGIPVGFSFRGSGDLKEVNEGGIRGHVVAPPLKVITWDAVVNPSHEGARIIRITESELSQVYDSLLTEATEEQLICFQEENGFICTEDGICYLPNDFDKLVEQRIIQIRDKYIIRKSQKPLSELIQEKSKVKIFDF